MAISVLYAFTLTLACVTAGISFLACLLYFLYERKGRFLLLVTLLVVSDGLISLNFAVWAITDIALNVDDEAFCRVLLPFLNFSYLLSFGYTMLIAQRFCNINRLHEGKSLKGTPLWVVPLVSCLLTLPIVIMNFTSIEKSVGEIINPSEESNINKDRDYCYYSSEPHAFLANLFCLQLPSLFTVFYNSYAYFLGAEGLNESAPVVKKREVRRAQKYLFVLLIVWIPSLGFNLYFALVLPQNRDPYALITFVVNLSSLQGLMNVSVYLWGYKPFRKWIKSLSCVKYLGFLLFGTYENDQFKQQYYTPLCPGDGDVSTIGKDNGYPHWDRVASGERLVRFGKSVEYADYVEQAFSDDDDEIGSTEEITKQASHGKPRKKLHDRIGRWWKRLVKRDSPSTPDDDETSDDVHEFFRNRAGSIDSIESLSDHDDENELRFKKTPPRRNNTRKDRSGSPKLVRVPSDDGKNWKKAPVTVWRDEKRLAKPEAIKERPVSPMIPKNALPEDNPKRSSVKVWYDPDCT